MNNIHVTLENEIVDLLALSDEDFVKYQKFLEAYKQNTPVSEYLNLVNQHFGTVTKDIFYSDLYRAAQDLEYRLRIKQGVLKPSNGDQPEQEPDQKDEFVTASEAAKRKDVSVAAIIKAVQNGRIAGHKNGQWNVSVRSLEKYSPDPARQHYVK
jgi:hypothetical protein